jgi:hypothetical protein
MTQDLSLLRPGMALSLAAALSASLALPAIGGDALQSAAQPTGPQVGETVAPFEAEAVGGTMQHVAFPRGSATVLLFFLSGCPSCHQMIPEWSRAYDRKPPGLTVWGVIMDKEPPGFFAATPITFPVLRSPGRDFIRTLKVVRAPTVLRVGPSGRIEDVAVGPVDAIRLGQIFRP